MCLHQQPQTGCNYSKSYLLKSKPKTSNKVIHLKPNGKQNSKENVETKSTYLKLQVKLNSYNNFEAVCKTKLLKVKPTKKILKLSQKCIFNFFFMSKPSMKHKN